MHPRTLRACEDAGFTLVELLVAISMFAVVLAATLGLFDAASRSASNETERNTAVSEATTGLDRMAAEIGSAFQVNGPTSPSGKKSDWIDFMIQRTSTSDYRVIYNCNVADPKNASYNACIRYQVSYTPGSSLTSSPGVVPTGASSTVVISRVINRTASDPSDYVFTNLESQQATAYGPTYGTATITTPARGETSANAQGAYTTNVVLSDSFYIRQLDFGR